MPGCAIKTWLTHGNPTSISKVVLEGSLWLGGESLATIYHSHHTESDLGSCNPLGFPSMWSFFFLFCGRRAAHLCPPMWCTKHVFISCKCLVVHYVNVMMIGYVNDWMVNWGLRVTSSPRKKKWALGTSVHGLCEDHGWQTIFPQKVSHIVQGRMWSQPYVRLTRSWGITSPSFS